MPRQVARTEELPKLPVTLVWTGLTTSTANYTVIPAGLHPRMRLVRAAYTTTVAAT